MREGEVERELEGRALLVQSKVWAEGGVAVYDLCWLHSVHLAIMKCTHAHRAAHTDTHTRTHIHTLTVTGGHFRLISPNSSLFPSTCVANLEQA